MATTSSNLAYPQLAVPIVNANGTLTQQWQTFMRQMYVKSGGQDAAPIVGTSVPPSAPNSAVSQIIPGANVTGYPSPVIFPTSLVVGSLPIAYPITTPGWQTLKLGLNKTDYPAFKQGNVFISSVNAFAYNRANAGVLLEYGNSSVSVDVALSGLVKARVTVPLPVQIILPIKYYDTVAILWNGAQQGGTTWPSPTVVFYPD